MVRKIMWFIVGVGWTSAWFGLYIAYANKERVESAPLVIESYHIKPGACTTDTDCMERFGGDGGPEPIRTTRM